MEKSYYIEGYPSGKYYESGSILKVCRSRDSKLLGEIQKTKDNTPAWIVIIDGEYANIDAPTPEQAAYKLVTHVASLKKRKVF